MIFDDDQESCSSISDTESFSELREPVPNPTDSILYQESPKNVLQTLQQKNADRIIIGHLDINSIRNKMELLCDLIQGQVDIFLVSETKLDKSFPPAQFKREGFLDPPCRLDRSTRGGGLLLYIRNDITIKPLSLVTTGIECIILDLTIAKKKWLLMGIYNPHKNLTPSFLNILSDNIDHYLPSYDNILLLGDFNSEMSEVCLREFCLVYNLKSLIKTPTCFMSDSNPSCRDLILTNRARSFQNSSTVETGISDFHHLVVLSLIHI